MSGSSNCSAVISVIEDHRRQQSRQQHRQGDAAERGERARAGRAARLLQRRVHGAQGRREQQEDERRRGERLAEDQPAHAEDVDRPFAAEAERVAQREIEPAGVRTHQEDPGDRQHRRRHEQREQDQREPDLAAGQVGALDQPGQRKADGEHERHRAGDEDESVRQDARIDHRIVDERAHVLERPLRARLEREEIRRPAERRDQQHRERHRDQIDRRAGAKREHQLGGRVEVVGFAARTAGQRALAREDRGGAAVELFLGGHDLGRVEHDLHLAAVQLAGELVVRGRPVVGLAGRLLARALALDGGEIAGQQAGGVRVRRILHDAAPNCPITTGSGTT